MERAPTSFFFQLTNQFYQFLLPSYLFSYLSETSPLLVLNFQMFKSILFPDCVHTRMKLTYDVAFYIWHKKLSNCYGDFRETKVYKLERKLSFQN